MRIEVLKGSIESELKAREQPTFGIAEKIAEPSVKLTLQKFNYELMFPLKITDLIYLQKFIIRLKCLRRI